MNLFFEEDKSTKPLRIIKRVLSVAALILMALVLLKDFNVLILQSLLFLLGLSALIDGLDRLLILKEKNTYFFDFFFAILYFTSAIFQKNILLNMWNHKVNKEAEEIGKNKVKQNFMESTERKGRWSHYKKSREARINIYTTYMQC